MVDFKRETHFIAAQFVWPRTNADVRKWARSCLQCQQSKIQQHTITPPFTFATPVPDLTRSISTLWSYFPFMGYTYLPTCIGCFTRRPEAILVSVITADTVMLAFISSWISRFGVPSTMSTDRGCQFESTL